MNHAVVFVILFVVLPWPTLAAEPLVQDCRTKANDGSFIYEGKTCAGVLSTTGTCKKGICILDFEDVVPVDSRGVVIHGSRVQVSPLVPTPAPDYGVSILDAAFILPIEQAFDTSPKPLTDQERVDSAAQRLQEAFNRLQNDPANFATHFDEVRTAQEDLARAKRLMDNPNPSLKDYLREFVTPKMTPTELVPDGEEAPVRVYEWLNNLGSTFGTTQVAENTSGSTLTDAADGSPTFEQRYNDFLARLDQLDASAAETERKLREYQKQIEAEIRGLDKLITVFPQNGPVQPTPAWLDWLDRILRIGPAEDAPRTVLPPLSLLPQYSPTIDSRFSSSLPVTLPDTVVLQPLPWTGETNLTEADLQTMLEAENTKVPLPPPVTDLRFSSFPPQILPPTVVVTPLPTPAPVAVSTPLPLPDSAPRIPHLGPSFGPSVIGTSPSGTFSIAPFFTALFNFYTALNAWVSSFAPPPRQFTPSPPKPTVATTTPATSTSTPAH